MTAATISIGEIFPKLELNMGGMADAHFVGVDTEEDFAARLGEGEIRVEWRDAVFHGSHPVLGEISATLRSPAHLQPSLGVVRAMNLPPGGGGAPAVAPGAFFPALSRNEFYFRFQVPRLGLHLESSEPIVNEAVVHEVPPRKEVFRLSQPARFAARSPSPGLFSLSKALGWKSALGSAFGAMSARALGEVVVESCNVRFVAPGGLLATLELGGETTDRAWFDVSLQNVTGVNPLRVSWMVWPRPEIQVAGALGTLELGEAPATARINLPRDIFFRSRWLVFVVAKPFEVDAATAVKFPPLS